MITELNRSYPTARKEHKCIFCGGTIKVGEKYERQTNKYDNQIYDWVCHLECQEVTGLLNMFDNDETDTYDEGFDPDKLSYHDIVLNIIKELKAK